MKTLLTKLESILKHFGLTVKLKKIFKEAKYPKMESGVRFARLIKDYILGAIANYQFSANTILEKEKDKKAFYNLLKQPKYDFSNLLKEQGYMELGERLKEHEKHKEYDSWCTNNRITIVLDKMECPRTSGNHEKSKKLHKSENGHYLINLAFVIGDSRELFDLDSVLYDPDCGKTSVEIGYEMLGRCIDFIKSYEVDRNRIRVTADREFIDTRIINCCLENGISYITRAKKNTVLYEGDFKFNPLWLKDFLFQSCLDEFKTSAQLDSWSKRNGKPEYKYWTKTLESNFGKVRIVAVFEADKTLTKENYKRNMHILISFNPELTAVQIIQTYRGQRWQIEVFHKSWKKDIEVVKSYIGLSFLALKNHYIFRALSYFYLAKYRSNKKSWKRTMGQNKKELANLGWSSISMK